MKQKKKETQKKNFSTIIFNIFHHHRILFPSILRNSHARTTPDSLIEFEQKYPEATDFVENYHKYKNKSFHLDVSHEVRKDNIPLFI